MKGLKLTGGPGLSPGERGEGGNWPAGPRPRKGEGGRGGFGPSRPKGGEREGKDFAIFFFKPIFQHIFQLNFLSN